ncbi:lipase family alpha/beta hydrolase [Alkaliphilus hydrothermalis]|uniref:Pimeloyl-ACP methyl ester carboxylesterase n=1 Tax=Alkaliphilus hydrothermalis TaxID=1482730 RepID=A0ABS2NNL7_9FIRM|nr:alpha/beta hydrolase [Alkaliphilus hydrothermalis]MBM7614417.1 pimeloyl-ACP methyl ester carboxylesterase [Alkaliphilus hydrothermalis]
MERPSKNPIIFLPGLMGSIGGEMIPGLKDWSFGVASTVYDPLIEGLEEMGYRKDQNLFICYYDWRKNTEEIMENFLLPMMQTVKTKYPNQSVDIIGHSMGGVVARQYVQGKYYHWDVEKLIMLGTPNKGSLDAYYLWSTGQLAPSRRKSFLKIIYRGYIWLLTKILNIPMGVKDLKKLHENFQGLLDLIPTYDYGDFLWVEDAPNKWVKIPRRNIKYKNKRLDYLNRDLQLLKNRVKEIKCFVGTGYETNKELILDRKALLMQRKELIRDVRATLEGDNTVTVKSASIEGVENIIMPTTHRGIVKECIGSIAQIYGVELEARSTSTEEEHDETLHIIFKGEVDLTLDLNGKTLMTYSKKTVNSFLSHYREEFVGEYVWLVMKNVPNGNYSLKLNNGTKQGLKMLVMATTVEEEYSSGVGSTKSQEIMRFTL